MKKVFTLVLVGSMITLAACSQKPAETTAAPVDSVKVDSAAADTAAVDSAAAPADTTKAAEAHK
jgi:hypothetical protein